MCRLRHSYASSAPAAERSVLLVNYENQRNAFKLVDIKTPPSPAATVNDVIYGSPRHWLNDSSTSPSRRFIAPSPAAAAVLYPGVERCLADCVYSSSDLQPCGCPRFLQTMSPSLPDVTSELYVEGHDDDDDDEAPAPEVCHLSRSCVVPPAAWQSSTVCRGCANVDAGPLPTLDDQQQQQQVIVYAPQTLS